MLISMDLALPVTDPSIILRWLLTQQAMPISDQDHRAVAMPVASALAGCFAQRLDFGGGQVLARPNLAVVTPCRRIDPLADNSQTWRRFGMCR
jgi:hypothetical protein